MAATDLFFVGNIVRRDLGSITFNKASVGLDKVLNALNNFNAIAPPTSNDDFVLGYSVGSRWIYRDSSGVDNEYTCLDNTTAAAVWTSTTFDSTLYNVPNVKQNLNADADPTITDDAGAGYSVGSRWINTDLSPGNRDEWICLDDTSGAANWRKTTIIDISGYSNGLSSHAADTTIHFHKNEIAHTDLYDISGTTSHASIDTQLATASAHMANHANPHAVTAAQVGLGLVANVGLIRATPAPTSSDVSGLTVGWEWIDGSGSGWLLTQITNGGTVGVWRNITDAGIHAARTDNPHQTTAAQVGLGNVPNVTQSYLSTGTGPNGVDTSFQQVSITSGYMVGSRWIDTVSQNEWVCIDASGSTNYAVWKLTTAQDMSGYTNALSTHVADTSIHFHKNQIAHTDLYDVSGTLPHSAIDAHINDISGNPHHITKATIGLNNVANILNSYGRTGTNPPTTAANTLAGYSIGSRWTTTDNRDFVCINSNSGIWVETTATQDGPLNNYTATRDPNINDDINAGYSAGSAWINVSQNTYWVSLNNTAGNALWIKITNTNTIKNSIISANPNTVNAGTAQAYTTGSRWFNPASQTEFVFFANSPQRWLTTTDGSGNYRFSSHATHPSVTDDASGGYIPGDIWITTTDSTTWILQDNTPAAALWLSVGGINSINGSSLDISGTSILRGDLIVDGTGFFNNVDVSGTASFTGDLIIDSAGSFTLNTESIVLGHNADATSNANANSAIAIGNGATCGDVANPLSLGHNAVSSGASSVAVGYNASALNDLSIAIGTNASANADGSIALGLNATTTIDNSFVCPQMYTDVTSITPNKVLAVTPSGLVGYTSTPSISGTLTTTTLQTDSLTSTTTSTCAGLIITGNTDVSGTTTFDGVVNITGTTNLNGDTVFAGINGSVLFSTTSLTGDAILTVPAFTSDTLVTQNVGQTLTNKTLDQATILSNSTFVSASNITKVMTFSLSTLGSNTTVTYRPSNTTTGTYTLVDTTSTQTLSNKTLSGGTYTGTSTFTGPVVMGNSVDISGTVSFFGPVTFYDSTSTKTMNFDFTSMSPSTDLILTVPASSSSDTMVLANATQTLTNKTLSSGGISDAVQFFNSASNTKKMQFSLSGITAGNTVTLVPPETTTGTYTLADNITGQILSNKTMSNMTVSGTTTLNGTTSVAGTATFTGTTTFGNHDVTVEQDLDVSGTMTARNLTVSNLTTLRGSTTVSGTATFSGPIDVTGATISGLPALTDTTASANVVVLDTNGNLGYIVKPQKYTITSSGNWPVPNWCQFVRIVMYGGGGGGGNGSAITGMGGGGGGGARLEIVCDVNDLLISGGNVAFTVGAGGTRGTGSGGSGSAGGNTSFTDAAGTVMTAYGGGGGCGGTSNGHSYPGGSGGGTGGAGTTAGGTVDSSGQRTIPGGEPVFGDGYVGLGGGGAGVATGSVSLPVNGLYAEYGGASGSTNSSTGAFGGSSLFGGAGGGRVRAGGTRTGGVSGSITAGGGAGEDGNEFRGGNGGDINTNTSTSVPGGLCGGGGAGGYSTGTTRATAGGAGCVFIFAY